MDCSHIQFQENKSIIDLEQLHDLFKQAAFWAKDRNIEEMGIAIANSNPTITVWDKDRLIGFSRATSDGVYRATIWDVVIHPDYQGAGLGRKLVETVIAHPQVNRVERVYLMTTHQQRFYERIGFEENQTTTMVLYSNANRLVAPLLSSGQKPEELNTVPV
ncbi:MULTISPECIES: GNAT family N-acetyltransferase [Spirulina sp. CCY15215]|uniref:GNAT family N-acetyltransferase n=1 Tax=Spirulina sp. CCY15215 TaxID=2767591 RepID=UPI00194FF7C3|nr:GNAT family N-acetyltransferase [Spirulina major]